MSSQRRKNTGRNTEEEDAESGNCDDEDECENGSGRGGLRIRNQLRLVPELDYDLDIEDVPFNKQIRNQQNQNSREIPNLQSGSGHRQTVPSTPIPRFIMALLVLLSVV